MESIRNLLEADVGLITIGVFVILFGVREVMSIIDWVRVRFRIKTGSEEDKELLEARIDELEQNDEEQLSRITKMSNAVDRIEKKILNIEISNMRKEILYMASGLSTDRKYNKEHFSKVFSCYEDYEQILQENGMENGQVEVSMQVIRDEYKKRLANGEFK